MAVNFSMYFWLKMNLIIKFDTCPYFGNFEKNCKKFAFLRISRKILILEKKCSTKNKALEILYKGPMHNFRNFNRLCVI